MNGLHDKDALTFLEAFLKERGLVWHQLSSFNEFIERDLENLYDVQIDPIELSGSGEGKTLHFRFGKCSFYPPVLVDDDGRSIKMYPKTARFRAETYGSAMHVDIHIFTTQNAKITIPNDVILKGFDRKMQNDFEEDEIYPGILHRIQPNVFLTLVPIMVGSRKCRLYGLPNEKLIELGESIYEPGGYFYLRGKERVIVPQKNLGKNTLFISKEGDEVTGTLHCCMEAVDVSRVVNKVVTAYDKELHDVAIRFQVNQIYAQKGVPIGIMLAALGMTDWKDVIKTISDFSRLNIATVDKNMKSCEYECLSNLDSECDSVFTAAWTWIGEHVSSKQRLRTVEPLPAQSDIKRFAAQEVVHHFVLPHIQDGIPKIQTPDDFWSICRVKALTLCHMIGQVLRVYLKIDDETSKDRMENKRYEMPGTLMHKLFKALLRPQLSDFRAQIIGMDKNNKPIDIVGAMCSERLQKGIASALQNGKFQLTKRGGGRQTGTTAAGVTQAGTRINPLTNISHMRKMASQGTTKIPAGARLLNPSQYGYQCPAETPEGQPCGIVNHLAMLCYGSSEHPSKIIFDWIKQNVANATPVYHPKFNPQDWRIVVNGRIAFSIELPDIDDESPIIEWIQKFRYDRGIEKLPRDVSISLTPDDIKEVRIFCDGGRLIRPLCVVKNGNLLISSQDIYKLKNKGSGKEIASIDELFRQHKLEFIDAAETEDTFIATHFSDLNGPDRFDFTHCEVCPLSQLGVAAGLSPFAECNQSPRNVYQAGMAKQAMGTPSFPLHGNLRTTDHVLETSEHPLVSTVLQRIDELPMKWLPTGQNCIVCVKSEGHNVEDSIVMNESFIQAGGLSSYSDRTYTQTAQKNHHHTNMEAETFERPEPEKTAQYKTEARYDKIDIDGLPVPGEIVTSDTVIIGKTGPLPTPPADPTARNRSVDRANIQANPNHTRRDLSTLPRKNGGGVVQSVVISHTRDTKRVAVTVRTYRKPKIGDKFCSRHGQKGTISRIAPADELPRALDGTIPDIIMNPHAFPSRMTAGNVLEGALGMVGAMTGYRRDATTFYGPKSEEIEEELFAVKLEKTCEKRVIDPKSGEMMNASLFIGQVYTQVLKHIVDEKIHARQRGPVTRSNRQPTEGRRRDGGLRFGEMEKDATVAHGAAHLTRGQLCDNSDAFPIPICETCGEIAEREPVNHESYICRACDSRDKIAKEILPYPTKQLMHYLPGMGISMTLMYGTDRSKDEKI